MANTLHTCATGETWDSIAFKYYADEFQASALMLANRDYIGTVIFEGGEVLTIPELQETVKSETLPPWRQSVSEV